MKTLFRWLIKAWLFLMIFALSVEAAPIVILIFMLSLLFGGTEAVVRGVKKVAMKTKKIMDWR